MPRVAICCLVVSVVGLLGLVGCECRFEEPTTITEAERDAPPCGACGKVGMRKIARYLPGPGKRHSAILVEKAAPYFQIDDVLLRSVVLPDAFKLAVEAKLAAEQKVLQKHFELEQAEKDAEIEVAKARGAAQAQEIVQTTLTEKYLQYLWISTLNANPNVIYVATEANLPIFKGENGAFGRKLANTQ